MKLFISYPRKAIAEIEAIRRQFPNYIRDMLDVNTLAIGENWRNAVESLVGDADYVLFYVNDDAAHSKAMEDELTWIVNRETNLGRDILLPLVTDSNLLHDGYLSALRFRNYITFNKRGIGGESQIKSDDDYKALVTEILAKLSILLIKERESRVFSHAGAGLISDDDQKMAQAIADLVLNTNQHHPKKYEDVISTLADPQIRTREAVRNVVKDLTDRKILGGVYYVMDGIFEGFDHYKLKALQAVEEKKRIAERAVDQINSGDIVVIDSGSTCNRVSEELVRHISDGMLSGLDVVVCSASAAEPFLDNVDYRVHNIDPIVRLHIRGGNVRLRNHAIVKGNSLIAYTDISAISADIRKGRKVKSFIGCNYFDEYGSFYSVEQDEAENKKQIIGPSDEVFILAASGKSLPNSEIKPFKFVDATDGTNSIALIIGGNINAEKRERIESTGVKVLTTDLNI